MEKYNSRLQLLQQLDSVLRLEQTPGNANAPKENHSRVLSESFKLTSDENGKNEEEGSISTGNTLQRRHQRSSHQTSNTELATANSTPTCQVQREFYKISVVDKRNRSKGLFKLPRDAVSREMGYFSEKSSSDSIQIECDLNAFNWIAGWLIEGGSTVLRAHLLGPILTAAWTLNAPLLLTMCLQFWRANVASVSSFMSPHYRYLDENVFTQFALLFSNLSLEELSYDEELQEILYQKFIILLNEAPNAELGHFSSTRRLFQCSRCEQLLLHSLFTTPCRFIAIDLRGTVTWGHLPHTNWSLSELVGQLRQKHGCWRIPYWRLWAACHFLFCSVCQQWFPLADISRCAYHSGSPYYLHHARTGNWTCCHQQYSYGAVSFASGCQYKSHSSNITTDAEQKTLKIYQTIKHLLPKSANSAATEMPHLAPTSEETHLIRNKHLRTAVNKVRGKQRKLGQWESQCEVGDNQDSQREKEEITMKNIVRYLTGRAVGSRVHGDQSQKPVELPGGSYVGVDAEWRKSNLS